MFTINYQKISDDDSSLHGGRTPSVSRNNDVEMTSKSDKKLFESNASENYESLHTSSSSSTDNNNDDDKSGFNRIAWIGGSLVGSLAFFVIAYSIMHYVSKQDLYQNVATNASFDKLGRYVMTNYDRLKPMANFLAGVGGLWGVPMWLFYVNRGQGVQSFGIANKDGGIAAFETAEKAYQEVPFTGFRTFLKGERAGSKDCWNHMPFFPQSSGSKIEYDRDMFIGMNEFEIEERAPDLGLNTNILYYTSSFEDFPALIRRTTFTNTDASSLELEVLDGLAKVIPYGLTSVSIDAMGRTLEAWMKVYNVGNGKGDKTHPFFRITQGTADTSTVQLVKEGHFAVAYIESGSSDSNEDGDYEALPFIVDPSLVYDTDTTLLNPRGFFESDNFDEFTSQDQGVSARTPCAFAATKLKIPAGESVTVTSILGHASDLETFTTQIDKIVRKKSFALKQRKHANELIDDITKRVSSDTSNRIFDDYVRQDMLDNVLRGGLPIQLGENEKKTFHVYSRIHGDLERDYNNFLIDTTYFSQGPGNFRDVNQNRRLDSLHSPEIGDFNIRNFLSFVQYDGYNPLTVASTNFKIKAEHVSDVGKLLGIEELTDNYKLILGNSYRPGQLFKDLQNTGLQLGSDDNKAQILDKIMDYSEQVFAAAFAQNGFWSDHWSYTLDLVDSYLAVYPDKKESMLWDSEPVPFYFSPAYVKPRSERYVLADDPSKPGQQTIVVTMAIESADDPNYPQELQGVMDHIWTSKDYVGDGVAGGTWQRTKSNDVYEVSIISKLALLGILKFATLDPKGMGIEYEGGKPGWNDAMNGLPGLLGSGMPETYESYRILTFVREAMEENSHRSISFPEEFGTFLDDLQSALQAYSSSAKDESASHYYWDATNDAREKYRASVFLTFSGKNRVIESAEMISRLKAMEEKFEEGIKKAKDMNEGLSPTYFYYECTDYSVSKLDDKSGRKLQETAATPAPITQVIANAFKTHTVPLFLEGPTRSMKVLKSKEEKKSVYEMVKGSELYDEELGMYTVSASLKNMGPGLGRMIAFSPGWLENQSVWLHMSYKWYLELLRAGLFEEYYQEIKTGLVPFMDVDVYGRSPLEAASFIVSSAFPDKKLHGSSFLARLSGSTAEFLSMWAIMFYGTNPFTMDDNVLTLRLQPALAGYFFKEDATVGFTFLGSIKVTYHNPEFQDTWKGTVKKYVVVDVNGEKTVIHGDKVTGDVAEAVRSKSVVTIDAHL
jgi:hypothetical protein